MGSLRQVRGYWQFYRELMRFPQWSSAERMCWLCRASSTNPALSWTQFGPGAGWRGTRWSHESYLAYLRAAALAIPVLLLAVIGFRLECVMIDTLHTVDQGVASDIIANVFWLIAEKRKCLGGANQEEQIAKLNSHMAER